MSAAPARVVILGAGGFARELAWLLRECNAAAGAERYRFVGYVVNDPAALGPHDSADETLGGDAWLDAHRDAFDAFALGIGTPAARDRVATELRARYPEKDWPALVHPSVRYDRASCVIEPGAAVCAGVIATVNVHFGVFSLVNLACTLGHEARIGRASVLNPTVNISGGVELGERVLVGTGAQVLQYLRVGDDASVGAGAVVTRSVEPHTTVVGVPAKPLARTTRSP